MFISGTEQTTIIRVQSQLEHLFNMNNYWTEQVTKILVAMGELSRTFQLARKTRFPWLNDHLRICCQITARNSEKRNEIRSTINAFQRYIAEEIFVQNMVRKQNPWNLENPKGVGSARIRKTRFLKV